MYISFLFAEIRNMKYSFGLGTICSLVENIRRNGGGTGRGRDLRYQGTYFLVASTDVSTLKRLFEGVKWGALIFVCSSTPIYWFSLPMLAELLEELPPATEFLNEERTIVIRDEIYPDISGSMPHTEAMNTTIIRSSLRNARTFWKSLTPSLSSFPYSAR